MVPKSGVGLQELPHLYEQESEGLCYIFAIAFRLLRVRWPQSSPVPTSTGINLGVGVGGGSGQKGGDSQAAAVLTPSSSPYFSSSPPAFSTALWPERRAFEPIPAPPPDDAGPRQQHRRTNLEQQEQQQQQRRPLRPPRPVPGTDREQSLGSGSGSGSGRRGVGRPPRNGIGGGGGGSGSSASVLASPMLVVDDLLDWSGEGDEGPLAGFSGVEGVVSGCGGGQDAGAEGVAAEWDGTALGREFLRREGSAVLRRYFVADGEVQRGR